ncbi:MAG: hypothetical protein HYR85_15880 [Planctomycetes bacterium]|nr:hypothetical protein [Planctomycetota bacterium]MBI3848607.1 hypothetical protein [Planctomycetota bacterium]
MFRSSAFVPSVLVFSLPWAGLVARAQERDTPDPAREAFAAREKRIAEVKTSIRSIPGWFVLTSANYVIVSDADREFASQAQDELEFIHEEMAKQFPSKRPIDAVFVVRLCKNESDYDRNGGLPGTNCVWIPGSDEMMTYDRRSADVARPFGSLYYGAFLQYVHFACSRLTPDEWFSAGVAECFSSTKRIGDRVEFEPKESRADRIREAAASGDLVPISKLVHYTRPQFLGKHTDVCVAESWGLVYFTRVTAKNERWRRIVDAYFTAFRDAADAELAAKKPDFEARAIASEKAQHAAFDGVDLADLERAIVDFASGR